MGESAPVYAVPSTYILHLLTQPPFERWVRAASCFPARAGEARGLLATTTPPTVRRLPVPLLVPAIGYPAKRTIDFRIPRQRCGGRLIVCVDAQKRASGGGLTRLGLDICQLLTTIFI